MLFYVHRIRRWPAFTRSITVAVVNSLIVTGLETTAATSCQTATDNPLLSCQRSRTERSRAIYIRRTPSKSSNYAAPRPFPTDCKCGSPSHLRCLMSAQSDEPVCRVLHAGITTCDACVAYRPRRRAVKTGVRKRRRSGVDFPFRASSDTVCMGAICLQCWHLGDTGHIFIMYGRRGVITCWRGRRNATSYVTTTRRVRRTADAQCLI